MTVVVERRSSLTAGAGPAAGPFLKCAGGKRQLLGELARHLPANIRGCYYEPFLGGGALFFHLAERAARRGEKLRAFLGDKNPFFAEAWWAVKDDVDRLLSLLHSYARRHAKDQEKIYYEARAFHHKLLPGTERAAATLYLNKTCWNGLWRVNKAGRFNVPMGRYANPDVVQEENLYAASRALQAHAVVVQDADFTETCRDVGEGDLVYFDPPYVPAGGEAYFTAYTVDGFSDADQVRLRDFALELKSRGARVILSNADVPRVRELYARFEIHAVSAVRSINSKAGKRGPVGEVIIT